MSQYLPYPLQEEDDAGSFSCHFYRQIYPLDFAYVDSQHPDQSYHVCLIKDFKQVSYIFYGPFCCVSGQCIRGPGWGRYHLFFPSYLSQTRRDSMIAEIVWFFRVQEIPESTYLLLLEDRKSSRIIGVGALLIEFIGSFLVVFHNERQMAGCLCQQ